MLGGLVGCCDRSFIFLGALPLNSKYDKLSCLVVGCKFSVTIYFLVGGIVLSTLRDIFYLMGWLVFEFDSKLLVRCVFPTIYLIIIFSFGSCIYVF